MANSLGEVSQEATERTSGRGPIWPPHRPWPYPWPEGDFLLIAHAAECCCSDIYLTTFLRNEGVIHNEILMELATNYPKFDQSGETTWDFIITKVEQKIRTIGLVDSVFLPYKEAKKLENKITIDPDKVLDSLVVRGKMTPFIRAQANIILNTIKTYSTSDASILLSGFVSRIAARNDVSFNEKVVLIGAAEVGIFSNLFWNTALANDTDPYHKIALSHNESNTLRKIKWADVIGAVVGGVLTSAAGPVVAIASGIALGTFASSAFGEK